MKFNRFAIIASIALFLCSCYHSEFGGPAPMGVPKIELEDWKLGVFYHSQKLCELSFDNLARLPRATVYTCLVRYEDRTGACGTFEGVRIEDVLKTCPVVNDNPERLVFIGADGYEESLDVKEIKGDWLIAFKVNGRALARDEGYPARAVVPGRYDYKWVRWLSKMVLIKGEHYGYWELLGRDNSGVVPRYIFKSVEHNSKGPG